MDVHCGHIILINVISISILIFILTSSFTSSSSSISIYHYQSLSIYLLSIYYLFVCLSVYPSVYLSIYYLSVCLSVYPSVYISIYLSIYLSIDQFHLILLRILIQSNPICPVLSHPSNPNPVLSLYLSSGWGQSFAADWRQLLAFAQHEPVTYPVGNRW